MKKLSFFVISIFIFVIVCFGRGRAETIIENLESVYGTWTADNSPYIIEGEAIVPQDSTLIIEPGVVVKLKTGTEHSYGAPGFDYGFLRVYGKIIAEGTITDTITFTRNETTGSWGIIYLDEADTASSFKYCKFEYGYIF